MEQATIIGIDLAKRVFQAHGAAADGSVDLLHHDTSGRFAVSTEAQQDHAES